MGQVLSAVVVCSALSTPELGEGDMVSARFSQVGEGPFSRGLELVMCGEAKDSPLRGMFVGWSGKLSLELPVEIASVLEGQSPDAAPVDLTQVTLD